MIAMKKLLFIFVFGLLFFQQARAFSAPLDYRVQGLAFQQGTGASVSQEQLGKELENIKERQKIVLEAVSGMFDKALWIFGFLGSVITLFNFFQIYQDSRVIKLLKEQVKEAKEITSSYQKNIESATNLIGSLGEVFEFQAKAQRMMEEIKQLKYENEASQKHWDAEIDELNKTALQLSLESKRTSYNKTDFQRKTREFREEYKNLSGSTETKGRLNANCFYILALDYRILNDYQESLSHFEAALDLAEAHKQSPTVALALYRALPEGKNLSAWLMKLQNVCTYHAAIIRYNLGRYDEAIKGFEKALTYDPRDYKSLTYIPEAMYLGRLATFTKIEATFKDVIERIKGLNPQEAQHFAESREQLLAQAYMKLGNCYLGKSKDEEFPKENLEAAEKWFRMAFDLKTESSIVKFSLAQAQFMRQREKPVSSLSNGHRDLFLQVFQKMKGELYRITEAKILMMNYYVLAICCAYGEIDNEIPQLYTMRIHEIRPNLPSDPDLRIFSPWTKNDLTVNDFFKEVEEFNEQVVSIAAKGQAGNGRRLPARKPERRSLATE
jgi:tetratricopeptide (TPR) repeat protein